MVTIKEKYKEKVVGFNNSATPLGKRDDLYVLAEIALSSGDSLLLDLFEKLPTLDELNVEKGKKFIEEVKKK